MILIIHDIKVAIRNLMKYKLQTLISVLSIAVGIVTLAVTQSVMTRFRLPMISEQSYFDRAYEVYFTPVNDKDEADAGVPYTLLRSLKEKGTLKSAETVTAPNGFVVALQTDFHLTDSTLRMGFMLGCPIDADYPAYAGYRSAVTEDKVRRLKSGEAIISEKLAKSKFPDRNPIGAVQWSTSEAQPIPVTIVDVYESLSVFDKGNKLDNLLYYIGEDVEGNDSEHFFYAKWINVVLKEGFSAHQLQKEIDAVSVPMGMRAELSKVADREEYSFIPMLHLLVFIIGALILLAAVIGFLRIEIQLLNMRHRELSLRIVNGATRTNLLGQLFLEILIPIITAVSLAILLGILLQDFLNMSLNDVFSETGIEINGLWKYSLLTGAALTAICTLIMWVSLIRFRNTGTGLAVNMRKRSNHLFRNIMLGLQITISIIFVCSTLIIVNSGEFILKASNVPVNDSDYREWLTLKSAYASQPERLVDEIGRLKNLDRIVMWGGYYQRVMEVGESQEALDRFRGQQWFKTICADDTTVLSLMGIDVDWFGGTIDRTDCLLIGEKLYEDFNELGLLAKGTVRIDFNGDDQKVTMPIGGIIRSIPYDTDKKSIIAIRPVWKRKAHSYLLIPKARKGRLLFSDVNEIIQNLEPQIMDPMVGFYRDEQNMMPGLVETVRTGGWILSIVSLLICAMSIFSSITLDTRSRMKEVAIRKVNGAKSWDIYKVFGRVYIWLILASLVIAVPVSVLFNKIMGTVVHEIASDAELSPLWPIVIGCLIVISLIFFIVFWQIHRVMQTDPAKIIAKE